MDPFTWAKTRDHDVTHTYMLHSFRINEYRKGLAIGVEQPGIAVHNGAGELIGVAKEDFNGHPLLVLTNVYEYSDLIFESYEEADEVIRAAKRQIYQTGEITIEDLFMLADIPLVGVEGEMYGWWDLDEACITRVVKQGTFDIKYAIELPFVENLEAFY